MRNIFKVLFFCILGLMLMAFKDSAKLISVAEEPINAYNQNLKDDCKVKKEAIGVEKEKSAQYVRSYAIAPDDIVFGSTKASVVLVEYFSPTCPHCVVYHKRIFPEIQKKYIDTEKIAYVMREFIGNKQDLDATILARCNGDITNYVKFMHVMFEQQDNWIYNKNYREILTNIASLGGISPEKYAACLNDQLMVKILFDNTKLLTNEPNFIGTPTFFINGKQFLNLYTFEELSKAIDEALIGS